MGLGVVVWVGVGVKVGVKVGVRVGVSVGGDVAVRVGVGDEPEAALGVAVSIAQPATASKTKHDKIMHPKRQRILENRPIGPNSCMACTVPNRNYLLCRKPRRFEIRNRRNEMPNYPSFPWFCLPSESRARTSKAQQIQHFSVRGKIV